MAKTATSQAKAKAEADDELEVEAADDLEEEMTVALGLPDEELETITQLTRLAERTIKPGVMRLPVSEVADAKNSPQTVIAVSHPVEGDIYFHFGKMSDRKTWDSGSELKRVLDWYGYTKRNMHALKSERLYVRYNPDGEGQSRNSEWDVVAPPSGVKRKAKRFKDATRSYVRSNVPPTAVRVGLALGALSLSLKRKYRWAVPTGSHTALGAVVALFVMGGMFLTSQMFGLTGLMGFALLATGSVMSSLVGAAVGILTISPPGR